MPKAETVKLADEPKDVKRVAASEGIGGKENSAPVEMAGSAGPKELDKMPFFQMLGSMSERQWEDRMVYLYRQDKTIIKADEKDSNYIERITHAFDEAYVKEKHGGGRFLAILKNVRVNGAERKHSFKIEGEPIIHADEVSIKKTAETAAAGKSELALALDQVNRLNDKLLELSQKNNGAENATISNAVSMLSEASRGALQIQQEAIKSTIGSSTGHPLVDKFLEASITKLGGESKGDDVDKLLELIKVMKMIQPEQRAAGGGLLGNLGEIKGVLEVLKEMGLKVGGGAGDVADAAGGMDWKAVLASTLPQALQVIGGYAERFMALSTEQSRILRDIENSRRAAAGQPQLPAAPQPQQTPPQQQPQAAAQTSAPAAAPQTSPLPQGFAAAGAVPAPPAQPQIEQAQPANNKVVEFPSGLQPGAAGNVDLDFVCNLIRRCWDAGDSGDIPAITLKRIYADALDPMLGYFTDRAQLRQFAAMSPPLAPIAKEPEFPTFLEEFVAEIMRDENALPEEGEEGPEDGGPEAS